MFNFNTGKLKNRILWGYSIPILLSLGVAVLVIVSTRNVENQLKLVELAHEIERETRDASFDLVSMQKTARGYVIAKNPESLASYREAKADLDKQLTALKAQIKDPIQQENLRGMTALAQELDAFNSNLISLVDAGSVNQAVTIWKAGKGRELSERLDKLSNDLSTREEEIVRERQGLVTASLRQLSTTVFLGNLLSSILAIALAWWIASAIAKTINRTINQVASSSKNIAGTVEQQERTVNQQAAAVSQTTITVDELGASSQQSAEQAEASAAGARQALNLAEGGTKSVQQTMEGMTTLKEQVGVIAEQILHLSEQTNQIGSISDAVGDIANQTNMLALNAAVEAARAGEHGKGFGVVATEIRKLADQSKRSAERINTLVRDIQHAIDKTVMVTDEGSKRVDEGLNLAHGTVETFAGVADSVNNVFLNSQQISLAA